MRSVLICQHDSPLVREIMPRWLASFTDLAGVLVIREPRGHRLAKVKRSLRLQGLWGTIDLLAYRLFHRMRHGAGDRQQEAQIRETNGAIYPPVPYHVPLLEVSSPNCPAAQAFIQSCQPEIMLACCKHILKPAIFEQASQGTYVMHPGICPEYRNAHGCFWALVNGDMERVGMTLLKIDRGIDTGPVYGYFSAPYDEVQESHLAIQRRMTYDNLHRVQRVLEQIQAGVAKPISTTGRSSAVWGQPTLSSYWKWKRSAKYRLAHPVALPESLEMIEALVPETPVPDQHSSPAVPAQPVQELAQR